jgi:hypothetical protein
MNMKDSQPLNVMKKSMRLGNHADMDDAEWEHSRSVIATTRSLAEAAELLEEEADTTHRQRRRQNESARPKRELSSGKDDAEAWTED